MGLLIAAAALPAVSTSSQASPFAEPEPAVATQSLETTGEAGPSADRGQYSVTSWAEMLKLKYGSRTYSYSTTGTGPIRWPFPTVVPISSGFGGRAAPCYGCSSYHQGLDLTPGAGAPIYAIADGTVVLHEEGGGFGNHVIIEHVVNGQRIRSLYAHMQWGSSPLQQGDQVAVGDFIGLVGATGQVTGAHLHFELEVDGTKIDPYAWLKQNAS
ncbi:MAG: M23 family metallopeptidase [Microbacteriaceae bacterium]